MIEIPATPTSIHERLHRVATTPQDHAPARFGHLEMHPWCVDAHWKGKAVPLTVTEFNLVMHLATQGSASYARLLAVYRPAGFRSGHDGGRANVRTFIKRIRAKFMAVDPAFRAIANKERFGYRWVQS